MKKISNVIKEIVQNSNFSTFKDVASLLEKTEQSVRNKYSLDNFTFKEIMMILDLCGYHIDFVKNTDSSSCVELDPNVYLSNEQVEKLNSMKNFQIEGQLTIFDDFIESIPESVKKEVICRIAQKMDSPKLIRKKEQ